MKPALLSSSCALRPSPLRSRIAWALTIAVLLVQTLGAMHRVAHADAGRWHAVDRGVAGAVAIAGSHGLINALFAGHAGNKDCDAYDQMSHGSAAVAAPMAMAVSLPPVAAVSLHPAWHIAAQARGFLARGPPAVV